MVDAISDAEFLAVMNDPSAIGHHGVKGMKWGVSRPDTNGDGLVDGGGGASLDEEDQEEFETDMAELGDPLFDAEGPKRLTAVGNKRIKVNGQWINSGESTKLTFADRTARKQGKVNKFVEDLFDHKTVDVRTRGGNQSRTERVKQGTVNRTAEKASTQVKTFMNDIFKKATGG